MPRHGSTAAQYVPSTGALRQVTSGKYERTVIQNQDVDLDGAAGTEVYLGNVHGYLVAPANQNKDELFSWFRIQYQCFSTSTGVCFEYMLVRLSENTATPPDLNSSAVVEQLQKERRILDRGIYRCMSGTNGKTIAIEKFNVQIPAGEMIALVARPIVIDTGGNACDFCILEWRKVAHQG